MAAEKAGGNTRRHRGTGRGKSEPVGRAAGKDAAPSKLVDIDPWSAFETFWGHEVEHDEREGELEAGTRMPNTKPRPRRLPRSS
jgi:hypothetical protein